jgi:hypothetical protein
MDIFRAICKRGVFSLAFTFWPLIVNVTIKKVPVKGTLRTEEQKIAALEDRPFGA